MTRSNDDWKLERSRRDARRLAEHNRRDQRLAFQLLTERIAKEAEPRRRRGLTDGSPCAPRLESLKTTRGLSPQCREAKPGHATESSVNHKGLLGN